MSSLLPSYDADVANKYADIVYCGWIAIEIVLIYFFAVETAGKTLEELSSIFEAKNPRKESTRKTKIQVDQGGNILSMESRDGV